MNEKPLSEELDSPHIDRHAQIRRIVVPVMLAISLASLCASAALYVADLRLAGYAMLVISITISAFVVTVSDYLKRREKRKQEE